MAGVLIGRRRTKAFVLPTLVICLVVVLASIGLGVDVGYLQLIKCRMQTAADAAAIGGVQEIKANGNQNAVTAAQGDAAANGFTNGANGVSVVVNQPPASGYYTADPTAVEVIITQNVNVLFMSVLGVQTVTVKARSVAHQGASSTCLYVLDPASSNAFQVSNGANVAVGCGIAVDSSSATAFTASGGARVTATAVNVAGGYQITNGASVSPTPVAHAGSQSDPLSYLVPPTVGACTQTNFSVGGGATKTINPGVYCNGINIANGATVTMTTGTYIVVGGGFNLGGGARITGNGVTIYLTSGSGYSYGPANISNGVTVQLTAPTTGSYAGILFYQDPKVASPAASSFAGGSSITFNGSLYFPTSALSYSNGSGGSYTILVSKTISFCGGTTLNADYSSLPGGSPAKGSATLSE
jgi:Putative Flp pilus-assembly TadE/G-like